MKIRCNQCMAVFNEEDIILSQDPLYFKDDEICPKCNKGGALMDIPDDDNLEFNATHTKEEIEEARQAVKDAS